MKYVVTIEETRSIEVEVNAANAEYAADAAIDKFDSIDAGDPDFKSEDFRISNIEKIEDVD